MYENIIKIINYFEKSVYTCTDKDYLIYRAKNELNKLKKIAFPRQRKITTFDINPVAKPRMTHSDKWKKRDCVEKYYSFKDDLNILVMDEEFVMPESDYHLIFYLPMPRSWSKKKKLKMVGQPHKQIPDKDNLEKAFLDALFKNDSHVWDGRVTKRWGEKGKIEIKY